MSLEEYQNNKDKPWYEWLEMKEIFKSGKQGLAGVMVSRTNNLYVFKVSQYINYLVQHEESVMKSLLPVTEYCPHFCRVIGSVLCDVDPTRRKEGNPFDVGDAHKTIEKEVLLTELVEKSRKFYNYITTSLGTITEDMLYAVVKQVLMAITIAQRKVHLTHYDLHSNNIMLKKCKKDLVFLYIIDEENQFCVPSMGYYPVIIDYGFSYSDGLNCGPMWCTLSYTEKGFFSDRFDPIADPKLFLVTVAGEIHESRHTKRSRKLDNIVKNLYSRLKIDWTSGWDNFSHKCVSDYAIKVLKPYSARSELFKEYDYFCVDIIQSLIILPIKERPCSDIVDAYKMFLGEFIKIEQEISSVFYCLYILKGICDIAREVMEDYGKKSTREMAINFFRKAVQERVDSVASFCSLKMLNYEKLLCGLLCTARGLEGIFFDIMEKVMQKKVKMYEKVPVKTPEGVFCLIEANIPSVYAFTGDTEIVVIDCVKESQYPMTLNLDEIAEINSLNTLSHGSKLYEILKKNFPHNKNNKNVL